MTTTDIILMVGFGTLALLLASMLPIYWDETQEEFIDYWTREIRKTEAKGLK